MPRIFWLFIIYDMAIIIRVMILFGYVGLFAWERGDNANENLAPWVLNALCGRVLYLFKSEKGFDLSVELIMTLVHLAWSYLKVQK